MRAHSGNGDGGGMLGELYSFGKRLACGNHRSERPGKRISGSRRIDGMNAAARTVH
ncbi:MAG: hypothetical protein K0Q59_1239, partial [Paenibacillus sp.]|nr:hypothetical protein [Paenibacillus sp.]